MNSDLDQLISQVYFESAARLRDPILGGVVRHGLNILYGPPIFDPSLAIITFQGGGADMNTQTAPPPRLIYRDDPYKFGTMLRKYMSKVLLTEVLNKSTIALPSVFPQAPMREAGSWMASSGPKADWRHFSVSWTKRLIEQMSPKVILVFGDKAASALEIKWCDVEREHPQNHMTFARAIWNGVPVVFCHHLSIGCPEKAAMRSLEEAALLIGK